MRSQAAVCTQHVLSLKKKYFTHFKARVILSNGPQLEKVICFIQVRGHNFPLARGFSSLFYSQANEPLIGGVIEFELCLQKCKWCLLWWAEEDSSSLTSLCSGSWEADHNQKIETPDMINSSVMNFLHKAAGLTPGRGGASSELLLLYTNKQKFRFLSRMDEK